MLVEEDKLHLDDSVHSLLENVPPTWKPITIRHLLTHTSGLVREFPNFDPFKPKSDAEALKEIASVPLRFSPGDRWEYSNVGYYVLAEIIRKVSQKPWSEFIQERVFNPSDMQFTRTTTAEIVPNRARGYVMKDHKLRNAPDWLVVRPSGAFLTTVTDLAKWDMALSSKKVLSPKSLDQMWNPCQLTNGSKHPYGFGWFVDTLQGHRRIRHDGGVPGFTSEFQRYEENHLTVIVLTNAQNRDLKDLTQRIAGFYQKELLPPKEKYLDEKDTTITEQVKSILAGIAEKKLDSTLFTPKLFSVLKEEVSAGFGSDIHNLGPVLSMGLIERKQDKNITTLLYRIHYKHVPLFVRCSMNPERKFSTFSIFD